MIIDSEDHRALLHMAVKNLPISGPAGDPEMLRHVQMVHAVLHAIEAARLAPQAILVQITVPAPPVLALSVGDRRVLVTWMDGADGGSAITAHRLYRAADGSAEKLIATLTGSPHYEDMRLTNGVAYSYRLSAVNEAGEGEKSAAQSVTPGRRVPKLPSESAPPSNKD
jgi:hypothetical protein